MLWQLSYQCAFLKKTSKLVNFYVAILILRVEENMQHFQHIMLYYFKQGKNANWNAKKDLCCVRRRFCDWSNLSKWFVKFRAEVFSLDDAPRSGRQVEVDGNQIETLIKNNQCYTMREIADILRISKSIKLVVKMKNVFYFMEKTKQTLWPNQYHPCVKIWLN